MMAIGMTYEQYWYGDVRMAWAFSEADRLKRIRENQMMWIQGSYVYDAIARLIPMFKFGVKNPKPIGYLKEPYNCFETKEEIEQKNVSSNKSENERLKAIMYFERWARAASDQIREKRGE